MSLPAIITDGEASPDWAGSVSSSTQSIVIGLVGARGSGKTLILVYLAIQDMRRQHKCFANLLIRAPVYSYGKKRIVESSLLDYVKLVSMDTELKSSVAAIDEINMYFDARRSQTTGSLLFNGLVQQIRKRAMSLYYTTQDFAWVDNRIRQQTDILIYCNDMYFSAMGQEEGLERGELINVSIIDKSGLATGRKYDPDTNPQVYHGTFRGRDVWRAYSTYNVISPFEGMVQMDIQKPKLQMVIGGDTQAEDSSAKFTPPEPTIEQQVKSPLLEKMDKRRRKN